MTSEERIEQLVEYLNARTKEYDEGNPTISDKEWDTAYFELKDLENQSGYILPNSPTQNISFEIVNELTKSEHNHKMLSLEKTKEVDEIISFLGNEHPFVVMGKMDGLTCSLRYLNGTLVSAETRGNGLIGENILHNANVISSIPKKIPYYDELIVDGEIICPYNDFEEFSEEYKNPRNFAAGSIRLLDSNECAKRHLMFVAWDVIKGLDNIPSLFSKLMILRELFFYTVPVMPSSKMSITDLMNLVKDQCIMRAYPIDGLVFKFDEVEYGRTLGETDHHFKNAMAFKFYDETYDTELITIELGMGRTGVLTPVAVFKPIDIDGSTVERASLHNLSVMNNTLGTHPYVGQKIKVFKSNMIIPQISWGDTENIDYDNLVKFTSCPVCGGSLEVKDNDGVITLWCGNQECEGKLINKLDHFVGKKGLDIKGLSKATLGKLMDWGWVNCIIDIFNLPNHKDEWMKKSGFGAKSVQNILDAIEAAKDCELSAFISAIGIPLIGTNHSKEICKRIENWDNFKYCLVGDFHFYEWEGFGEERDYSLKHFNYREADFIAMNILKLKNSLWSNSANQNNTTSINNMNFVITGKLNQFKNRAELQSKIESLGGKVIGSVSKNTNYLINNDNASTSAKNVSAKKLGIPIITEEEFLEIIKNS